MLKASLQRARLACFVPTPADTSSFVRGIGPLAKMLRQEPRLSLVQPKFTNDRPELTWDWLAQTDLLFMQRPGLPEHVACTRMAKSMGLKVWLDWDDDNLSVRRSNPTYPIYARPEVRTAIQNLAQLADIVSVSTVRLAQVFGQLGAAKVVVIPNACHWSFSQEPRRRAISWRGTKHHFENLTMALPQIGKIANDQEFTEWEWHFLGEIPRELHEAVPEKKLKHHQGRGIFPYMENFAQIAPWVNIAPLPRNDFNLAKSNLAWLEASAVGAITLAPDWDEWLRPGIVNYGGPEDFSLHLKQLLRDFDTHHALPHLNVDLSRKCICEEYLIEHINRSRWAVLNEYLP